MKLRFPLSVRILAWLCLNLLFLGLGVYLFVKVQFHLGLDSLLLGRAGDRIQALSDLIAGELSESARSSWNTVLSRYSEAYQVRFLLFAPDGEQESGEATTLPAAVFRRLREGQGRPEPRPPGALEMRGIQPPPPALPRRGPSPKFMLRTDNPTRYWVGVRLPMIEQGRPRPRPATLLLVSDSMRGGGLFFDPTPWAVVGAGALLFSVLFWSPLVHGITHAIAKINQATRQIAEGQFEVRIDSQRRDKLGALAQAINRMAARLQGFVSGQKRFLGDIAHELCSPIARVQVALGILEQRADQKQLEYVGLVREEMEEMSKLVNELLSFSRAGLGPKQAQLVPVKLSDLARRVVEREAPSGQNVEVQVDDSLVASADPELLSRAVANLVRNAATYASSGGGKIEVSAAAHAESISLIVSDRDPGVPENMLKRIFDPFFRVEASRSRETGGVGLGLAIVKTCVEACGGTVKASNRAPTGLRVEIELARHKTTG